MDGNPSLVSPGNRLIFAASPKNGHRSRSARSLRLTLWLAAVVGCGRISLGIAAPLTPAQTEFFEAKVRPILVEHCYKCHSAGAEKIRGGLTLDTRDGLLRGGDTGPGLVPGQPDNSLLIKAVRYADTDLQMPPGDKKLPDPLIGILEDWVRAGAPDPRTEAATTALVQAADLDKARQHWAYKPLTRPQVPAPEDPNSWSRNEVDRFILAALQAKGLSPSVPTDKATLLRRATFDLHGLPPGTAEVDAFVADESPEAWGRVIDRLLASPRYGERWGRHWLDLAKYADTSGRSEQGRDNRYLWSWTYRDWVIRAFNEDLPYDQFILRQMAADQLDLSDRRDLAAMGFLTLGNRFGNNLNDIIDDRIDLVGKSTMALTLACARCHDHKFDPLPTRDYYSLHGVFASSFEPQEGPVLDEIRNAAQHREYLRQLAARESALENFTEKVERDLKAERHAKVADYLMAWHEFKSVTNGLPRNPYMQRRGLDPRVAAAWNDYLKARSGRHHRIWTPWFALEGLSEADFATGAAELARKFSANSDPRRPLNAHVSRLFATPPANLSQVAARYSTLLNNVGKQWEGLVSAHAARQRSGGSGTPAPTKLDDPELEDLREVFYKASSPVLVDDRAVRAFIQRDNRTRDSYNTLVKAVNDVKAGHPGSPPRAHMLEDAARPRDSYVMIKGNPGNRGPIVPRQAPLILAPNRQPFTQGSGRLELARAIVSPENPLTARVMANRIWLHHFGTGLATTPDDFGLRSDPPTHPELLDYLAVRFRDEKWSIKSLHRFLMLSATYQQSSQENPRQAQIDPGNRYYWQFNRQRLDFESLRDTILQIGGRLDLTMGGPGIPLDREPYPTRRSVYGYIDRARLPNMMLAFDFANPDLSTGRRSETIVPQQALFMMNSPLVVEQARQLTLRPDFKAISRNEDRIALLYRLIYQRVPTDLERRLALDYIQGESAVNASNAGAEAWEYGYGEYDAAGRRLKSFVQLTNFRGNAWSAGGRQNARPGPVALTAKGGRPGSGAAFAAVRRWTARQDGFVSIDGTLAQNSKEPTDVVAGWIVSSGTGQLLGPVRVQKSQAPTRLPRVLVRRGDTLDFIVTGQGAFSWSPILRLEGAKPGQIGEWNAEKDFSGTAASKHMEPWEKLAQVLLETNELTFVN